MGQVLSAQGARLSSALGNTLHAQRPHQRRLSSKVVPCGVGLFNSADCIATFSALSIAFTVYLQLVYHHWAQCSNSLPLCQQECWSKKDAKAQGLHQTGSQTQPVLSTCHSRTVQNTLHEDLYPQLDQFRQLLAMDASM